MLKLTKLSTIGLLAFVGTTIARADSTTVQSTAVIYAAGNQSSTAASDGGTAPVGIAVSGATSYTFSASGQITLNGGTLNDADGVGAATGSSSNTGTSTISGISAPNAGYLVGVFIAAGGPTGSAPASLDFTSGGLGTSFTSLSPLIDQVFFVGDGLTGDGTGSTQTFFVPTGAGELYLGISDAGGYNGGPGSYGDNADAFSVTYTPVGSSSSPSPVPEPSSLVLLSTGALTLAGSLRRKFQR